jgi:predicted branched-subunit amino acid permease
MAMLIRRVQCGLPLTDEEYAAVNAYLDAKIAADERRGKWMTGVSLLAIAVFATVLAVRCVA